MMRGITRFGAYVPMRRLSRKCIVDANKWFNPNLGSLAKGERAAANWDEDALTMAVEAARDCLNGSAGGSLSSIFLSSTSAPFRDRLNAGILRAALELPEGALTLDLASCLRAGTSGLIAALKTIGTDGRTALCVASDKRRTKAGSTQELSYGDAAAAFVVGSDDILAEYLGCGQGSDDFVDHYRTDDMPFDYGWEERWIADEGYRKIMPRAVASLFAATGLQASDVDDLIVPAGTSVARLVARSISVREEALCDNLSSQIGDCGTAYPLLQLAHVLQSAKPSRVIVMLGWGNGCDALAFRTTAAIGRMQPRAGVVGHLARRQPDENYCRHLAFNQTMNMEQGLRAETDRSTSLSALYRNRDMATAFVGGCCTRCGTRQFPKSAICVNPNCRADGEQEPYSFREEVARIQSCTADNLIYCPDPPQRFGMVGFEGGGRLLVDFTDVSGNNLEVGSPMRMVFRIKEHDRVRGFAKYFWKATPAYGINEET
jgi:3-hydroxy-3-methylglutaryl CoA synthase